MNTTTNYFRMMEETIQDSFFSFLAEETIIRIIWFILPDEKIIHVGYHDRKHREICNNQFHIESGATITNVIKTLEKVIDTNDDWIIKKRNWFQKRFSVYGMIIIPKDLSITEGNEKQNSYITILKRGRLIKGYLYQDNLFKIIKNNNIIFQITLYGLSYKNNYINIGL